MDQIGVVGLSYRHAGTEDIAGFTLPKDELTARLASLRESLGTAEVVYLATCNRVEVAFAMPEGEGARDLRFFTRSPGGRRRMARRAPRCVRGRARPRSNTCSS